MFLELLEEVCSGGNLSFMLKYYQFTKYLNLKVKTITFICPLNKDCLKG